MNSPGLFVRTGYKTYNTRKVLEVEHLRFTRERYWRWWAPAEQGKAPAAPAQFLEAPSQGKIYFHNEPLQPKTKIPWIYAAG
jgi:hypothetical protein